MTMRQRPLDAESAKGGSICSAGRCDRLARVRLTIFLPCRRASRSKTAGGEPRLGMVSMYMETSVQHTLGNKPVKKIIIITWVHMENTKISQPQQSQKLMAKYRSIMNGTSG